MDLSQRLPSAIFSQLTGIVEKLELGEIRGAIDLLQGVKGLLKDEANFCSSVPINLALEH